MYLPKSSKYIFFVVKVTLVIGRTRITEMCLREKIMKVMFWFTYETFSSFVQDFLFCEFIFLPMTSLRALMIVSGSSTVLLVLVNVALSVEDTEKKP